MSLYSFNLEFCASLNSLTQAGVYCFSVFWSLLFRPLLFRPRKGQASAALRTNLLVQKNSRHMRELSAQTTCG